MKTLGLKVVSLFFLMVGGTALVAQDRRDVPGDDFSLEGALELFKESASPEEFERKLNSPDSRVNNLDLNGDGDVDYIRVIDRTEGNVHLFIMQAVLSSVERQDVAVIELEKLGNGKAVLQITGDEDVYGIETIIEPTEEVRVNAGASTARTVVNVWTWPSVQYVYSPYYRVWVSPWHWYNRPIWWYSWRPVAYYDYYNYWYPYRRHYAHCYTHRVVYARTIYRPHRTYSPVYYRRHETRIVHYRSNHRDERNRYEYDRNRNMNDDHNRFDGRTSRDHNTVKRTPTVGERNGFEKEKRTEYTSRERRQSVDGKPERTQREPVTTSRQEVRKPVMTERTSSSSTQQRDTRSFNKPSRSKTSDVVRRSGGSDKERD